MSGLNERMADRVVKTRATVVELLWGVQERDGQLVKSVR